MAQPPKFALSFFRWFCHPRLQKPIEGDLMELYDERVKEFGMAKADRRFVFDVLQLFRPKIIKPVDGTYRLNNYGMFQNHVKSAWRNLLKRKRFSTLNILGLSIGMASCLLILQYVRFEKSYDQFHPDVDNIYRLALEMSGAGSPGLNTLAANHPAAGPAMKADYPQVEEFTRLISLKNFNSAYSLSSVTADGQVKIYYEEKVYFADPSFLTMFNYPLVE
jgi:putative ABC transport system permease protein